MHDLLGLSPDAFAEQLVTTLGARRAFAVHDPASGRVTVSHPALAPLARFLEGDRRDFHEHEGLFFEVGQDTGTLMGAFVHCTRRGNAQGGLRYWPYPTVESFLRDGLRLAQGMTRKNALAGIWWGGGKGLIARAPDERWRDPDFRRRLYREYGRFTTSLRGCYVTAEDAGTWAEDMRSVFETTRFTTCIPPALGGSGNPSPATALGVVRAMEGALDHLGLGSLAGKSVAMQGTGNVAAAMIGDLLAAGVGSIVASEISEEQAASVRARYPGAPLEVVVVAPSDHSILARACDIVAPNALGGVLNPQTIPQIRARIVCGAANNQLLDETRDAQALRERGVVYVPDFLCNRMGIVHCANEQYGQLPEDPAIQRHLGRTWENAVYNVTRQALELADGEGITTAAAANRLADSLALHEHPIWGHRGRTIIDSLVRDDWRAGAS